MKILRSEAVDKSPGVFSDPEHDSKGPGTPGAIKQAKNPIFWKIPNFQKIAKNIKKSLFGGVSKTDTARCSIATPDRTGPGRTGPDQAGPDQARPDGTDNQ